MGLYISKGFSVAAYARKDKKKISKPQKVLHNLSQLSQFSDRLKELDGEARIVYEQTGSYSDPIDNFLQDEGFLSVVLI